MWWLLNVYRTSGEKDGRVGTQGGKLLSYTHKGS